MPVPVTGLVIVFCLLLKVVQSPAVRQPQTDAEAAGQFKVKVELAKEAPKAVPEVPVAMVTDWRFLPASVASKAEAVEEAMLMLFPLVTCRARMPVEEATLNRSKLGLVEVPWTIKLALSVVVPIKVEPAGVTLNTEMPVAVLTWKGFWVPAPWTNKDTLEEEALTPAVSVLPPSIKMPVPTAEVEDQMAA